jgi:hypothetical protein
VYKSIAAHDGWHRAVVSVISECDDLLLRMVVYGSVADLWSFIVVVSSHTACLLVHFISQEMKGSFERRSQVA